MKDAILVTGAAGHLGRAVLKHLLGSQSVPAERLIATTRDPSKLADLAEKGVTVRAADFNDAASLSAAFAGVGRALIISTDAVPGSKARLAQHKAAVAALKSAGAGKLFYTSIPMPDVSAVTIAFEHLGTEEAILETGLPHVFFRDSWYSENVFMSLPQAIGSGQWFTSAGEGRIAYGARDDYAAAIAASLASDSTDSAAYTLTGPDALTVAEVAALTSEVTGKPIAVIQLSDEQLAGGLKQAGLPQNVVDFIVSIDKATREGHLAEVTDDVPRLSGRRSQTLRAFLEANKNKLLG